MIQVPYNTGKVKIGFRYDPQINYCNPVKDWIQKLLLSFKI